MSSTQTSQLSDAALNEAAECLKVLAHPVRLRIVELLGSQRLNVGELAERCAIAQNLASEHLRLMQRCGFLQVEREGRAAFYRVSEDTVREILGCITRRYGTEAGAAVNGETGIKEESI